VPKGNAGRPLAFGKRLNGETALILMSTRPLAAVVFACLLHGAVAQAPPLRHAVVTATDCCAGASLLAMNADGVLQIDDGEKRRTVPRLVELRQEGALLPAFPTRSFLLLTNGDRIPLDPEAAANLTESKLRVWPDKSLPKWSVSSLTVYAPNVVMLFWSVPDGVEDAELFYAKLHEERRKHDVVYLQNGDRIEGALAEINSKAGVIVMSDRKKVQTPWSKLAGIAWNTDRQARLRSVKTHWHAVLKGGARLNFPELGLDEKSHVWSGKTQFGAPLELPMDSVLSLEVRLGSALDLAELTPVRYEQRPYLGVSWPLAKNAAVTGHPLRLSSGTYEKGLSVHAPCRVSYALNGAYQRFDSLVGFDETQARRGRARLAVEFDGKRIELNGGIELTSRDPPLSVQLDVRGVREMTLIADLGSFGDVQAHVNWVAARLIKKD
jgi:hypothetical protein